jgi:hypothetical protein
MMSKERDPAVDRTDYYGGDEAMRMAEAAGWGREGCLFSIATYLYRLGAKDIHLVEQDAKKALWYAKRLQEKGQWVSPSEYVAMLDFWARGSANLDRLADAIPSSVRFAVENTIADLFETLKSLEA